jgi:hypothetical protein
MWLHQYPPQQYPPQQQYYYNSGMPQYPTPPPTYAAPKEGWPPYIWVGIGVVVAFVGSKVRSRAAHPQCTGTLDINDASNH